MSDQEQLITKEQVKKWLRNVLENTWLISGTCESEVRPGHEEITDADYDWPEIEKAIDALKPVAGVQDAVSRKKVLEIVGEEVDWHPMATRIENLPPIPPKEMKLILDGDGLKKKFREVIPKSSYANQINVTPQMLCDLADECKLDPAELLAVTKELNLAAVKVLGELKKRIAKDADQAVSAKDINLNPVIATYDAIETMIADLESSVNLEELREKLVQAGAWRRMLLHTQHNNMAQTEFEMHVHLKEARAELEKGDKTDE